MLKTLSGALEGLIRRRDGGGGIVGREKIASVEARGDVLTRSKDGQHRVLMTNDQPQQAGTTELVLKTDRGERVGIGRG